MDLDENKEIVRRYQEAYNTADYDALDDIVAANVLTPNMISSVPPGLEGAKLVHQRTLIGMPDYHTTIEDLIAEGDKVVARVTMTGTHTGDFYGIPPTGRRVDLTGIFIVRIANGKIMEHWGEEDGVKVLRQLGFKIKLELVEG
ncbi:MAG TPA: ester cyclase [Anaerolineales bacterium]|nr:ester cyclase [Anaerolineales bacterium]